MVKILAPLQRPQIVWSSMKAIRAIHAIRVTLSHHAHAIRVTLSR